MTPTSGDPVLLNQCLEFCQALATKGQNFSISITLGPSFTFSLDTRGETNHVVKKKKKKPSPSRLRRNQKRKEDFLKKKLENSSGTFKCNQCENVFNSENGLKIHKGKVHKKVEVLRSDDPERSTLKSSPSKEVLREEQHTPPPSLPSPPHHLWARLLRGDPASPPPSHPPLGTLLVPSTFSFSKS